MIRSVLDANVFASALINDRGTPGRILTALFEEELFELILSTPIRGELRRILFYPRVRQRIRLTDMELARWIGLLPLRATLVEVTAPEPIIAEDPDDDFYLATAREGLAEFLVSGDRHLLHLQTFQQTRIVSPKRFLEILEAG